MTFNQGTPDPVRVGVHELTTLEPVRRTDEDRRPEVVARHRSGMSYRRIAEETRVPKSTVERWCKEAGGRGR